MIRGSPRGDVGAAPPLVHFHEQTSNCGGSMRATSFVLRGVSLLLVCGIPALAQRTAGDPSRAGEEWLDRCREGRNRYNDDRERYCEVRERRLSPSRTLDIDGRQNGSVSVHGWDRSEVVVLAKIQTDGEDASDARDVASRITIDTDGGRVRADGPSTRRRQSWSVSYDIWTPQETNLRVATQNGGISIGDIDARLDLSAVNGGIALRGVSGDVRGETTNGPLNVELDGDRWRGAGLDLRTTNGPVNLDIPEGYSARLETGTVNGGMRIDFPVTLQGVIGRRISTQLGNGGAPIRAVTTNGPVEIRRR
jgi:Putative adhesin